MPSDDALAPTITFETLGLDARLVKALAELGYEEPTPIQRAAIPAQLDGRDVLGQAATGTGKTAAFALPLLQRLCAQPRPRAPRSTRALVLVPTRELAMQVAEAIHRYGKALGVRAVPIYGGQPIDRQIRALSEGVDVVLATPGRALDHLRRGSLAFDRIETVVIDEADEMLDMGFAEDLEELLAATPKGRQTALFSATLAPRIVQLAERQLRDPLHVRLSTKPERGAIPTVRQSAYVVARAHKIAALVRVLDLEQPPLAIIFCRTRLDVEALHDALAARGFTVELLHGGMSQEQRDRAMRRFRTEVVELMVATDVAARGLDVKGISHVVNFDVPPEPDDYVHRIGRTGRAGRAGVAITLIEPREHRLLRNIERATQQRIEVVAVPTVADLRARKLELTTTAIRETIAAGELERYRVVVETLASEHDIMEIALAAVKLAHVAQGADAEDEREIPRASLPDPSRPNDRPQGPGGYGKLAKPSYGPGPGPRRDDRGNDRPGSKHPLRRDPRGERGAPPRGRPDLGPTAQLFIGAGHDVGVRAKDLVGAIANEAGLEGRAIGAIQIAEHHALVELPAEAIDHVAATLGRALIRGKRREIRRA